MADTSVFEEIDLKLAALREQQAAWTQVTFAEKVKLLDEIGELCVKHGQDWVDLGVAAKRLPSDVEGDEWSSVFPTTRLVRLLKEGYEIAAEKEKKGKAIAFAELPDVRDHGNQKIVTLFPSSKSEKLMYPGMTVDMYLMPGEQATQGTELLNAKKENKGAVSLVLGAGNQSSIPFMDALYKLFNENQVVFLKHNPVCEWLYPIVEKIFAPLIKLDFFHHVKGGADVGKYLVERCDNVHITGSDKTHDIIVWGNLDKKTASKPNYDKVITSELGCVSPWIFACDNISSAEMDNLIEHIAGAIVNNNSFNCNAAKVLVLPEIWTQRDELLQRLKTYLSKQKRRYAYYPGAQQRYETFMKKYPKAEQVGETTEEELKLPWLVIEDVGQESDEYALCNEPFCPVVSTVVLKSATMQDFLSESVAFCNDKVWGNLTCSLFVDPKTEKKYQSQVDKAIDDLKYGGVAVNVWSGVLYALGSPVWGAFPGNSNRDIQSGSGFVHNSFLLDHPQKCVVRSPFTLMMGAKYPYFPSHKTAVPYFKAVTSYEGSPSVWGFAKTMWQSIWG